MTGKTRYEMVQQFETNQMAEPNVVVSLMGLDHHFNFITLNKIFDSDSSNKDKTIKRNEYVKSLKGFPEIIEKSTTDIDPNKEYVIELKEEVEGK